MHHFHSRLSESDISSSSVIPRYEDLQAERKILSDLPLVHLRLQSELSLYLQLSPQLHAWVKTPQGYTSIPSQGIPQELRNYPVLSFLINASIRLTKDSRTKEYIGFSIHHCLLGGSSDDRNALEICKDIVNCVDTNQFQNVLALIQQLDQIPLKEVKSSEILSKVILESLVNEKTYSQNSSISQAARLIIAKVANHYLIHTISMNKSFKFDLSRPLKIIKDRLDNRLYIELKLTKYLLGINPNDLDFLGRRGKELLAYVANLNLSQTILEMYRQHPSRDEAEDPPRNSKKTKKSLLGRYLTLKTISCLDPDDRSIKKLILFSKEANGWKTLYYVIEAALAWCLSDYNPVYKNHAIENIILPLTIFDGLKKQYNWRVREKAYESMFLIENYYFSNISKNAIKMTKRSLEGNKRQEKDTRVIKTLKNKQFIIARFNIGHMHWKYTPQKQNRNKLNCVSYFQGREKEIEYMIEILKTKSSKISILGTAGIGKTELIAKTVHKLLEYKIIHRVYPDGVYYYDFSEKTDRNIFLFRVGCNSYVSLADLKVLKSSLVLLDRTDCLSHPHLFKVLSALDNSSLIIASRRFTDLSDWNIYLRPLNFGQSQSIFKSVLKYNVDEEFCRRLGGLPLAINEAANYIKKNAPDSDYYKGYNEFKKWFKEGWKTERMLVSQQAIDKEFTTGFVLRDSLKVLPKTSMVLLTVLASMDFKHSKFEFIDPCFLKGLPKLLEYGFIMKYGKFYRLSHLFLHAFCSVNLETTVLSKELGYFTNLFIKSNEKILLYRHGMRLHAKASELGYYKRMTRLNDIMRDLFIARGMFQEILMCNEKALKAADKKGDSEKKCYYILFKGTIYQTTGENSTAAYYFRKALDIKDYKNLEEIILEKLAESYIAMSEVEKATKIFKRLRKNMKRKENKYSLANYLEFKAYLCELVGNSMKCINCLIKALNIYENTEDQYGQMFCLIRLGKTYYKYGNLNESINCFQKSLDIYNKIETSTYYKYVIILSLGKAHLERGECKLAIEYISSSLKFFKNSIHEDSKCECYLYMTIAMLMMRKANKSREYIYMAEEISRNKDLKRLRFLILCVLSLTGAAKSNAEWAEYFEEASKLANEIRDKNALVYFKYLEFNVHYGKGDFRRLAAILNDIKNLLKFSPNPVFEANYYFFDALLQLYVPDFVRMERNFEKAIEIFRKFNIKYPEAIALLQLGLVYRNRGKLGQAFSAFQNSHDLFTYMNLKRGKYQSQFFIAVYYHTIKDFQKSEECLNSVLKYARKHENMLFLAMIRTFLALQCFQAGKFNDALKNINISIDYFRKTQQLINEAYAIGFRGLFYLLNWNREGVSDLRKMEEILRTIYPPNHPELFSLQLLIIRFNIL